MRGCARAAAQGWFEEPEGDVRTCAGHVRNDGLEGAVTLISMPIRPNVIFPHTIN